eukprot:jgi/Tetstr1/431224/TSEL_020936.t2
MDYRDLADRDFGGDHVGTDDKVGLDKPPTSSPGFKGVPATDAQLHCHIPGCQEAIPIVLGGKKPKRKLQTCPVARGSSAETRGGGSATEPKISSNSTRETLSPLRSHTQQISTKNTSKHPLERYGLHYQCNPWFRTTAPNHVPLNDHRS